MSEHVDLLSTQSQAPYLSPVHVCVVGVEDMPSFDVQDGPRVHDEENLPVWPSLGAHEGGWAGPQGVKSLHHWPDQGC